MRAKLMIPTNKIHFCDDQANICSQRFQKKKNNVILLHNEKKILESLYSWDVKLNSRRNKKYISANKVCTSQINFPVFFLSAVKIYKLVLTRREGNI